MTRHPTAEWLARQITEAFPWASAPAHLVRDNDRAYSHVFTSRVRAMGIRDRTISFGSPSQNGNAERLIGTLRRECLDQMVILGEAHLVCRKMRRCDGLSNDPVAWSLFPSWRGYITNTAGYDSRKGQRPNLSFQHTQGAFLTVIFGQIFAYSAFSNSHNTLAPPHVGGAGSGLVADGDIRAAINANAHVPDFFLQFCALSVNSWKSSCR